MGLLDDAIREHLELKRRRGADPGEVAREQREALEPVRREEDPLGSEIALAAELSDAGAVEVASPSPADGAADVDHRLPRDELDAPAASDDLEVDNLVQETAEIDMQTVLDESERAVIGEHDEPHDEDSLEWEMLGDAAHEQASSEAQQEATDAAPSEDVLEATPDFLRETPEQERLWFEQHSPRDFDFDQ